MSKATVNWREVLDCKVPGMERDEICAVAHRLGYGFFCHNDRLFEVGDETSYAELKVVKIEPEGTA